MRALAPLLAVALATLALAQTQAPAQPAPSAGAAAEAPVAPAAPEPGVSPGAPSESELAPKPESAEEGVALPEGFVAVPNPAFPRPTPAAPVASRGRRYTAEDFAPYFAEGVLKDAKAAFDRGQYAQARRLLDGVSDPSPPVRYLRALAALRGDQDALAAPEMLALAEVYPALRDRCLTHAAVAFEALGQLGPAAEAYGKVPEASRLWGDAQLGLARVLRRQRQHDAAVAALTALAERPPTASGRNLAAEALLGLADLHAARKDRTAEREALWRLWGAHPQSPLAKQAERRLAGQKAPVAARVARAEALVEAHRNRAGMDVLKPLLPTLKLPDPVACRAHFVHGKALRKEREHTRAIAALTPVVRDCQDADLRARALYVLGSSRSIVDQQGGPATYEQLAREFPRHTFADDALFYAADLYVKTGRPEEAQQQLAELVRAYPGGDFVGEALFKRYWILRAKGDVQGGLAVLADIEKRFARADETYDVERARYWRARTLQDGGDAKAAADLFERLAVEHPATYYGLMARNQLAALDPARQGRVAEALVFPAADTGPWPLHAGPLSEDPRFLAGVELIRLGFPDAAPAELLAVNRAGQPAESVRLVVHALALAGDARSAHAVARVSLRRDLSGRVTPQTRSVWEVAYPNAYRPLIEKHTAPAGIEADLLQALMREESALDPRALSWAGALGLTQLMPGTAREVARELKLKRFSTDALMEPDTNIRLGAWYLGNLVRRFGGNKFYAIGSYNAGAGAINRWRAERPEVPLDAWVEEIPIAETRGYVKRVLRSFNTYQLLYGRAPAVAGPPAAGSSAQGLR